MARCTAQKFLTPDGTQRWYIRRTAIIKEDSPKMEEWARSPDEAGLSLFRDGRYPSLGVWRSHAARRTFYGGFAGWSLFFLRVDGHVHGSPGGGRLFHGVTGPGPWHSTGCQGATAGGLGSFHGVIHLGPIDIPRGVMGPPPGRDHLVRGAQDLTVLRGGGSRATPRGSFDRLGYLTRQARAHPFSRGWCMVL